MAARLLFAALVLSWLTVPASAQLTPYCDIDVSDVAFGVVDTLQGTPTTTGTVDITCGNGAVVLATVDICLNLNAGSGGSTGGARHLRNGSNDPLDYAFYSAPSTPWGSSSTPALGDPVVVRMSFSGLFDTVEQSVTIYAEVAAGQTSAPTGTYASTFSGSQADFRYAFDVLLPIWDCSGLLAGTENPTFAVTAEIEDNCIVTAEDIDFGDHTFLDAEILGEGRIDVTCTAGTSYAISLNGGLSAGLPEARLMTNGGEDIQYGLYMDAGRNEPWGSSGEELYNGTGSGGEQQVPVYARVPPQTTPPPGDYTDTVIATVTY